MSLTRVRCLVIGLVLAAVLLSARFAVVGSHPVLADNSTAAQSCQQGGYRDLSPDGTTPFRNAGACASFAANGGTLVPMQTCPTTAQVALNTTSMQSSTPTWMSVYSASSTYNIFFAVDVLGPAAASTTPVNLYISMPSNQLYESFSNNSGSVVPIACGERFWFSMPVAGTLIDQSSITGTWAASAYASGQSVTTMFTINS